MATKPPHSTDRRWRCSALVSLFIALTAWTSVWPPKPLGAQMSVAVHAGQLSVDLREAQVQDVLAMIGQQAGLRVQGASAANRTVSAQFADMELDQGLRRLLRAASLSYTLLYARGPAATSILQEVRVFGEAPGQGPARHDRAPLERELRAALPTPLPQEEQAALEQEVTPEQDADAAQD
jgi:hypothetical protein